jgi:hypothetical protein
MNKRLSPRTTFNAMASGAAALEGRDDHTFDVAVLRIVGLAHRASFSAAAASIDSSASSSLIGANLPRPHDAIGMKPKPTSLSTVMTSTLQS